MSRDEQIYQEQAEKYEELISKQPRLDEVIKEIRPFKGLDIVDLGAGSGRLSAFLAAEANSLTCTDASKAMLDVLEKRLSDLDLINWKTVLADHRDLPIQSSTADLVVSGWSLCYLASSNHADWETNLALMMSEIGRMIRKNGTAIIFETMGTGVTEPDPPDFLTSYYSRLENEYGFKHKWIRMDYSFQDLNQAMELTGFFFGEKMARKVLDNRWTTVPECAGIWYKHF